MELGRLNGINGLRSRILNRWSPTNTDTDVPIASAGRSQRSSSNWVYDGSYIRLKNISLSYTIPKSVLSGAGFKSVRVYVSAQNILTITDYPGVDVEVGYKRSGDTKNTNVGLDYRSYPNAKSVTFGLNLGF